MNPYPIKNGTTAQTRGGRIKITFELNAPQEMRLEFDPPTEAREGAWGPQYMYFVDGDRIAFLEPEAHQQIVDLGAKHGSLVCIVKRKAGRRVNWEVAVDVPAAVPPPPDPPLRSQPRPRADLAETLAEKNLMTAALRQAIEACEANEFNARPEDIRALAISIYIQLAGGRR